MSRQMVMQWATHIQLAARASRIQPSLVAGVMERESGGDNSPRPWGTGPYRNICVTSVAGAIGLMQVMPFWFDLERENPCDPAINIWRGCFILRHVYDRCGEWDKAVAGYFGALDSQCRIREWADASGTTGPQYVALVREAQQMFLDLDEGESPPPVCAPGQVWDGTRCVPLVIPAPDPKRVVEYAAVLLGATLLVAAAALVATKGG